ncbi:Os08g0516300 [Oryza sativa Japonica Group]|uniref:Os08g0516300 protein n=1 Tax=Oryza sativa subsp. japonica TaxID=39947 RepID=A0A0P0XHY3_ORYSJ|nr:Os08g0516300 [Oryza sativa Japonica Group]
MLNETDANTHLIFEIFFMGKDGLPAVQHSQRSLLVSKASQGFRFDAWWRFVKLSELDSRYVVTFICGLIILRNHNEPIAVPPSNLGNQLGIMVGSANGSDISFSVGSEMFHAHRAVLAARSPMFHADANPSSLDLFLGGTLMLLAVLTPWQKSGNKLDNDHDEGGSSGRQR